MEACYAHQSRCLYNWPEPGFVLSNNTLQCTSLHLVIPDAWLSFNRNTLVHLVPVFLLPNIFLKFKFLMNKMSLKFIFLNSSSYSVGLPSLYLTQSNANEQILRLPVHCMWGSNPSVRHCNANFFSSWPTLLQCSDLCKNNI